MKWFLRCAAKREVSVLDVDGDAGAFLELAAKDRVGQFVLEPLLDERARLVCFPHCSNVIGEINPVAEIAALAHRAGAFVCVDGASYAPHGLPNVAKLGADIYEEMERKRTSTAPKREFLTLE